MVLILAIIIAAIIIIAVGLWALLRTQEETLELQRHDLEIEDIKEHKYYNGKQIITEGFKTASMTRSGEKVRFKMRNKIITGYRAKRFGQNGWDYYSEDGSMMDDVVDLIIFIETIDDDVEFGISGQTFDPALLETPDSERETKPEAPSALFEHESFDSSSDGGYDSNDPD